MSNVISCFSAAKVIVYKLYSKYFSQISIILTDKPTISHFLDFQFANLIVFSTESTSSRILRNRL